MPVDNDSIEPPLQSLWNTLRYGLRIVWASGPRHCIAMGSGALVAALLAPVTIVVLSIIVNELNEVISSGEPLSSKFNLWIFIVAGATFVGIVLSTTQAYAKMRLKDALSLEMQKKILLHAATLDAATLDDRYCQNILERANTNPGQKILDLLEGLIQATSGTLQVFALAGVLLWVEPWWTLGMMIAVIPMFAASYAISKMKHRYNRIRTTQRRWTGYYARMLTHRTWSQTVKVLGISQLMLDRHESQMKELLADNRRIGLIRMAIRFVTSLVLLCIIGGAIWYAAHRAAAGALDVGKFTAFWIAAWRFRDATGRVGTSTSSLMDARLAIANLNEFFDLKPRMVDTGTLAPPIHGTIAMRNVSFSYTQNSAPVLEDVSLDISPGEIVALVGPNGAGKSTLAKLIARLYSPTSGELTIDGVPIGEIRNDHYYRHVALVQQAAPMFEATAGENIAFGDWENLKDHPDRIREIAGIAGVDQLLDQLPEGLDTMLGRMFGEYDLSGGQWKKISLARALAGNRPIVILDEPAANLDIQTERLMHQQLKQILKGRTTILISHHFSSVMMADRIIVLVDGRIEEQGTHRELQDAGGVYASMCRTHREMIGEKLHDSASDERSEQTSPTNYPEEEIAA